MFNGIEYTHLELIESECITMMLKVIAMTCGC